VLRDPSIWEARSPGELPYLAVVSRYVDWRGLDPQQSRDPVGINGLEEALPEPGLGVGKAGRADRVGI